MQYIIKTQSGISGLCNLGDGPTEKQAWEDAFGPKPWTPYQKQQAKKAWCVKEEVDGPVDYSGHN